MINTLLATKKGMTQTFVDGVRVPVTKLIVGPCTVTQVKTQEKDGYWSLQLGFGNKKISRVTKPLQGHLKESQKSKTKNQKTSEDKNSQTAKQTTLPRYLREIRLNSEPEEKVGDLFKAADIFVKGDVVQVTGVSKGKGFAGVMKRWNFGGGPRTHGQSDRGRAPGSIGQGTDPGRVWKGKKMAGRMGGDTVTIKNLVVVDVNEETGEVLVSGQIPGNNGTLITLTKTGSGGIKRLTRTGGGVQVAEGRRAKLAIDKKGAAAEAPAEAPAPEAKDKE